MSIFTKIIRGRFLNLMDNKNEIKNKILDGFSKIGNLIRTESWNISSKEGINPTQFQIINLLGLKNKNLTITELSEYLGITRSSLSDSVISIEKKGFIKKIQSKKDLRFFEIELTQNGFILFNKLQSNSEDLMQAFDILDLEKQTELLFLQMKLIKKFQDNNKIISARICFSCKYFQENKYPENKKNNYCNFINEPLGKIDLVMDCNEYDKLIN